MKDSKSPPVQRKKYQRLVDKLSYLSHTTPDITYVVSVVSHLCIILRRLSYKVEFQAIVHGLLELL